MASKAARTERGASPQGEHAPASEALLDYLPADTLALVVAALLADDELAATLSCRRMHAAVACARQRDGRAGSTTDVMSALSSVEQVEWAVSCGLPLGLPLGPTLCYYAAARGRLDVIVRLRAHGCLWDVCTCRLAAANGHLDVLQYARANGCPWGSEICQVAAVWGHLEVLQWAHANGSPWGDAAVEAAAGGHLSALQMLLANGCPRDDEDICRFAAACGRLGVLRWAHANGCPLGSLTIAGVREEWEGEPQESKTGREVPKVMLEVVVEWLRAKGCPEGDNDDDGDDDDDDDSASSPHNQGPLE
jgi:hypothetical protein